MEYYGDSNYEGYNLDKLGLDEYYLNIESSNISKPVYLFDRHIDCVECPYSRVVHSFSKNIYKASTLRNYKLSTSKLVEIPDFSSGYICDLNSTFGEFGIYNVTAKTTGCTVDTVKEPVNVYLSILTVAGIYILLALLIGGGIIVYKKWIRPEKKTDENKEAAPKKPRISSIDTFRGITIALMIFVNYGGGGYYFVDHVTWNGLHVADLAFPWFVWIMGACIPMSLASSFKKGISNTDMMKNVIKRSIKLFCLGIFLGGGSNLSYIRIFGVLQRFGVSYFVVTTICIYLMERSSLEDIPEDSIWTHFKDILKIYKGWIASLIVLIIYIIVLITASKPGCPPGYMGPGGYHKHQKYFDCVGGITGYVDEVILGNHRYQNPTILPVFSSKPFDPEGILGCLPLIFQVFLGLQAGSILQVYKSHYQRLLRWLSWAVITGLIGGGLCGFSREDGLIPVNKNLWSLSFVFITSSFAFFMVSICYVLVDLKKWWSGKPFLFAGMNAILMYIGHEMSDGHFPIRWVLDDQARRTHFWCLMSDVWGAGMWILVSYYLYTINYFFTI